MNTYVDTSDNLSVFYQTYGLAYMLPRLIRYIFISFLHFRLWFLQMHSQTELDV